MDRMRKPAAPVHSRYGVISDLSVRPFLGHVADDREFELLSLVALDHAKDHCSKERDYNGYGKESDDRGKRGRAGCSSDGADNLDDHNNYNVEYRK